MRRGAKVMQMNYVRREGEPRNEASNVSNTSGFTLLAIEQKVRV